MTEFHGAQSKIDYYSLSCPISRQVLNICIILPLSYLIVIVIINNTSYILYIISTIKVFPPTSHSQM